MPVLRRRSPDSTPPAEFGLPFYINGVNQFDGARFKNFFEKLERMKLLDETLVILTSDHGEAVVKMSINEPSMFFHCNTVSEELIRVPLIFWCKGSKFFQRKWSDLPVSTIDILPTALDFLGLVKARREVEKTGRGLSRAPIMRRSDSQACKIKASWPSLGYAEAWFEDRGKVDPTSKNVLNFLSEGTIVGKIPRPSYSHFLNQRTVHQGSYKLIENASKNFELYNLENDPLETTNLLHQAPLYDAFEFAIDYKKIAMELSATFPNSLVDEFHLNDQKHKREQKRLAKQLRVLGY